MARATYDKNEVIKDLMQRDLTPTQIADKYGISVENVYTIKSQAKREGMINSRGFKTLDERIRDEQLVLTPKLREKIKCMRDKALTSTEITLILKNEGVSISRDDVIKVMARGSTEGFGRGKLRG